MRTETGRDWKPEWEMGGKEKETSRKATTPRDGRGAGRQESLCVPLVLWVPPRGEIEAGQGRREREDRARRADKGRADLPCPAHSGPSAASSPELVREHPHVSTVEGRTAASEDGINRRTKLRRS